MDGAPKITPLPRSRQPVVIPPKLPTLPQVGGPFISDGTQAATLPVPSLIAPTLPGGFTAFPPVAMEPSSPPLFAAPELDAEERYARAIAAIGLPKFTPYRNNPIAPANPGPIPQYDTESQDEATRRALRIAAIMQGIGSLGGSTSFGTQAAGNIFQNYTQGAKTALKGDYEEALRAYGIKTDAENRRVASEQAQQASLNRAIDQANDNRRISVNNQMDRATAQYRIDQSAEEKAKDRKLKSEIEQRRGDERTLREILTLARGGKLTPQAEEQAATLVNKLTGAGFSPDFLSSMTPYEAARIRELGLSREARQQIAEQKNAALLQRSREHDQAVTDRTREVQKAIDGRAADMRRLKADLQTRIGARNNAGQMALKRDLNILHTHSVDLTQMEREALAKEKIAADFYKRKENLDPEGQYGLTPSAEEQYLAAKAEARKAHAQVLQAREEFNGLRDKVMGYDYSALQSGNSPAGGGNPQPAPQQQGAPSNAPKGTTRNGAPFKVVG